MITVFQNTASVLCAAGITSHCPAHVNHISGFTPAKLTVAAPCKMETWIQSTAM